MATITEQELSRIVEGILEDRSIIIRHNPLGSEEEILLWMLLSCLVSYLSLTEQDTPCFTGRTDAETYRQAIAFVLHGRKKPDFDHGPLLDKLRTV